MKIIIKATRIRLTPEIKEFVEEKIGGLEKFSKVFQSENYYDGFFGKGKPRVEAWTEIEKTTRHHRKGPFFRAECQMCFPDRSLRAESFSENVKQAIIEVKNELQRQLKKYRQKQFAKYKKGAIYAKRQRQATGT